MRFFAFHFIPVSRDASRRQVTKAGTPRQGSSDVVDLVSPLFEFLTELFFLPSLCNRNEINRLQCINYYPHAKTSLPSLFQRIKGRGSFSFALYVTLITSVSFPFHLRRYNINTSTNISISYTKSDLIVRLRNLAHLIVNPQLPPPVCFFSNSRPRKVAIVFSFTMVHFLFLWHRRPGFRFSKTTPRFR